MPRPTKPAEEATTTTVGATTAILAPGDGMIVLDPARPGHPLPAAGRAVPLTSYWLRRIADGDVVRIAKQEQPN